jgi:hypothetical protein
MGVDFEGRSTGIAGAALNPEVVQDDAFADTGNGGLVEWSDLLGHGGAQLVNFRGHRIIGSCFEFESRDAGRHRIDVVTDHTGTTATRLDKARAASDKRIEYDCPLKRDRAKIHVPEPLRLAWFQGEGGQDGAELRAQTTGEPSMNTIKGSAALPLPKRKCRDLGNRNLAGFQQGVRRESRKR